MTSTSAEPDFNGVLEEVQARRLPPPTARRRLRVSAGLTLRDIGAALDVAPLTVQRWETGRSRPRRDHALRYRELLERLEGITDAAS